MAVINGNGAAETLPGTAAADTITGAGGDDTALMGAGNDVFIWNVGDGDDTIKGGVGTDRIRFNGDNNAELFTIGTLVGGFGGIGRNLGGGSAALDDVERIELQTLGGNDEVRIRDLGPSDVTQVAVDLSNGTPGVGDGKVDILSVEGTIGNNSVTLTQAGGLISVTGLAAQITFAAAETIDSLAIDGLSGNDKINAAALPAAVRLTLDGGEGNDTIAGSAGIDVLAGGDGNDVVSGGLGNDLANLGAGNDLFIWNHGDGSDVVEGGDGVDKVRFIGSVDGDDIDISGTFKSVSSDSGSVQFKETEVIEVRALGGFDLIQVDDLSGAGVSAVILDLAATSGGAASDKKIDSISVLGGGLDDSVKIASAGSQVIVSGLAAQVSITHTDKTDILDVLGLDGSDTIDASKLAGGKVVLNLFGGNGADKLLGSAGNDFVLGGEGNDVAFLGAGNDLFHWDSGDDNDTIEGQAGIDTLQAFGAELAENIDIFADSGRAQLFLSVGNVNLDSNDVERISLEARGGADNITVSDLSGTDLKLVAVDLSASAGGGDLAKDTVTISGTNGNDKIQVTSLSGAVLVTGLASQVSIGGGESAKDSVTINAFGGNDVIDASTLPAGLVRIALNGGGGNDVLKGGAGSDDLSGGDGNDVLTGGKGFDNLSGGIGNDTVTGGQANDVASLGTGDDLFLWGVGDTGDFIEGEAGIDTVRQTGSNLDESFIVSGNGAQTRLDALDTTSLEVNDVEIVEIRALGGADSVIIGNLAGSDVTAVAVDLAATAGGKAADTKADVVTVLGTLGGVTTVTSAGSKVAAVTSQAQVTIDHWGKGDVLALNGDSGNEFLNASALAAKSIELHVFAGDGNDTINGGAGNDQVSGDEGKDTAFLGAGNDTFFWISGDGNDVIDGQAGLDTLHINGINIAQTVDFSSIGGRVALFENATNGLLDLDNVERIEYRASDGGDSIFYNDLSATDVKQVAIDLAASGIADGATDSLFADGTDGNNAIKLSLAGGGVVITGLAVQMTVAHANESDLIYLFAKDGNDSVNAAALKLGSARLGVDGGDGNDIITGGLGNDELSGGEGNDKVLGGGGDDQLSGANGNDKLDGGAGRDFVGGGIGNDALVGGAADDTLAGGAGDDTLTGGTGNDTFRYNDKLDGHDVIVGFDGNAVGGQDTLDLDALFDDLGVAAGARAGRVFIDDNGASVDILVDTDGNASFDLTIVTLKTADPIAIGQDVLLGS